jgi:hypothetical protein
MRKHRPHEQAEEAGQAQAEHGHEALKQRHADALRCALEDRIAAHASSIREVPARSMVTPVVRKCDLVDSQ